MQDSVVMPSGRLSAVYIPNHTRAPLAWRVKHFLQHGWRSAHIPMLAWLARRMPGMLLITSSLRAIVITADGRRIDYGIVSRRVITTAGVNYLVGTFAGTGAVTNIKYHGVGTGTNAENQTDTALQTESTTALNPDSTRATGSTTTGGSANIYRTVGTLTFDASAAITEHGILTQAATGGGTLWDRSVFSAINVLNGDSIQFTYDCTFPANG